MFIYMSNNNITDLLIKIEKLEKIRLNQLKANKKYYEKNKDKIIQGKKLKYEELKTNSTFIISQKERSKIYYEKNKEDIKKKNLGRYYQIKDLIEFPEITL